MLFLAADTVMSNTGSWLPSSTPPTAGTGFALSRVALDRFGDGDILPQDSLTEDYRMSLTLYEAGVPLYYVLERIPRVNASIRPSSADQGSDAFRV